MRWRVLLNRMECSVGTADLVVKAACCLHNFLLTENPISTQSRLVDHGLNNELNGEWRSVGCMKSVTDFRRKKANRARANAEEIRGTLTEYFGNYGAVSWQDRMI